MRVRIKSRIFVLISAAVLLSQAAYVGAADLPNGNSGSYTAADASSQPAYLNYLKTVENTYPEGSFAAENQSAELRQGQTHTAYVRVSAAGLYAVKLTYRVEESKGQYPSVAVAVNATLFELRRKVRLLVK